MRFALLVARTLGRTLDELCQSMTADEFGLWLADYQRDPWGEVRADLRAGIVAAAVTNMAGKTLRQGKTVAPGEFMPRFADEEVKDTPPDDPMAFLKGL